MMKQFLALFLTLALWSQTASASDNTPVLMLDTGGHMAGIRGIAFTPDGKQIVSASHDKTIRVWDLASSKTVRIIRGEVSHGSYGLIYAMALSPDGKRLAAGGYTDNNEIRLYDFKTGELIGLLTGHDNVIHSLAFSPDSKLLISGSGDNTAIIWDIENKKKLNHLKGHKGDINTVAFSPDGTRIATGSSDRDLRLWQVGTGKLLSTMEGHTQQVRSAFFHPQNGTIFSTGWDYTIRQWDGKSGKSRGIFKHKVKGGWSIAISSDGKIILTDKGEVWDIVSGHAIEELKSIKGGQTLVAISQDSRSAATVTRDNSIMIWDLQNGKHFQTMGGTGANVWAVGFSKKGKEIAWGQTNKQWKENNYGDLEYLLRLPGEVHKLGVPAKRNTTNSTDMTGPVLKYRGYRFKLEGADKGNMYWLKILQDDKQKTKIDWSNGREGFRHQAFSFHSDGNGVVTGGANGILVGYDLSGKKLGSYVGHTGYVYALAPSPDNRLLLSGATDQTLKLWNLKTRELIATLFYGTDKEWVMWTPQGYYTSSAGGDRLVGWQVNRGPDKAADYFSAYQLKKHFNRPDIVEQAIILASANQAVSQASDTSFTLQDLIRRRPPDLSITLIKGTTRGDKAETIRVNAPAISLSLKVAANDDPVNRIEIFVNGKQVTPETLRKLAPVKKGQPLTRQIKISLHSGPNKIIVRGVNQIGLTERSISIFNAGEGALDKRGTLHIVAIGVNKTPDAPKIGSLSYAAADAIAFHDTVARKIGSLHTNVKKRLLVTGATGENAPTRSNIINALADLTVAKDNDTVVVFLAGHGKNVWAGGRENYYFLSSDTRQRSNGKLDVSSPVSWSDLASHLSNVRGRRMLFVDTCYAASSYNGQIVKGAYDDRIAVFSGADANTEAQEKSNLGHGVFTYVVLRGLEGRADIFPQDKKVELYEFAQYIDAIVKKLTGGTQWPEIRTQGVKNYTLSRK